MGVGHRVRNTTNQPAQIDKAHPSPALPPAVQSVGSKAVCGREILKFSNGEVYVVPKIGNGSCDVAQGVVVVIGMVVVGMIVADEDAEERHRVGLRGVEVLVVKTK